MVTREWRGMRLDKFLVQNLGSLSRSKIHLLIQTGRIVVDGKPRKPAFALQEKQAVRILAGGEEKKELKPFDFPVKIIYEDSDIIVIDKPSGVTVHPPQAGYFRTLVNALLNLDKELFPADPLRPGVVHRLDKETSGVMVLAKNRHSYTGLVEEFKTRKVKKQYLAIVWGKVKKESLRVNLPLSRDKKQRLRMKVGFLESKSAVTDFEVVKVLKDSTLLAVSPLTGRTHQIRVHLKFLGYPIAGDSQYGRKDNVHKLLLHAASLGFFHPSSGEFVSFTSALPERFKEFIREHQ